MVQSCNSGRAFILYSMIIRYKIKSSSIVWPFTCWPSWPCFAVVALAPPSSSSGTLLQQIAGNLLAMGCFSFNPKLWKKSPCKPPSWPSSRSPCRPPCHFTHSHIKRWYVLDVKKRDGATNGPINQQGNKGILGEGWKSGGNNPVEFIGGKFWWKCHIWYPYLFSLYCLFYLFCLFCQFCHFCLSHSHSHSPLSSSYPFYGGEALGGPPPIVVTAPHCQTAWHNSALWLMSTSLAVLAFLASTAPALFF